MEHALLARLLEKSLSERLRVMSAVLVTGARQTGKSTLARELTPGGRFRSLDDLDVLDLARRDTDEYGDQARPGLLLHAGTVTEWLAPDVLAAPWWRFV